MSYIWFPRSSQRLGLGCRSYIAEFLSFCMCDGDVGCNHVTARFLLDVMFAELKLFTVVSPISSL